MEIQIFSPEMKRLCYLDAFQYFFYQRNYYEADTFQITIGSKSAQYEYCRAGNILVYKNNGISVACLITSEEETSNGLKTTVQIKGIAYGLFDGRYLLDKVQDGTDSGYDVQTNNAETMMKHFVNRCCIYPAKVCRKVPNLANAPDLQYGETFTYKGRFQLLQDALTEIGRMSGLGWHCYYEKGTVYFDVLRGVNMTQDIKFSQDEGNIIVKNTYYSLAPSTAIITDSVTGEGKTVIYQEQFLATPIPTVDFVDLYNTNGEMGVLVPDPNIVMPAAETPRTWIVNNTKMVEDGGKSGLARREILVECSDSSVEADMIKKGAETLNEKGSVASLTVELINKYPYEYMKDFFIGDVVLIKTDRYEGPARIVRVEEEILQNGSTKFTMTIGKVREDMKTQMDYNNKIFMNEVRK
jgi:hypothetical protein